MASFRMDYPPSVNRYWRMVNGRMLISKDGRLYRSAAMGLTDEVFTGPVQVSLEFTYPDNRRRDLDNVLKAVLDAIGHAGIYADDSQVRRILAEQVDVQPPGCVDVIIEPWTPVFRIGG